MHCTVHVHVHTTTGTHIHVFTLYTVYSWVSEYIHECVKSTTGVAVTSTVQCVHTLYNLDEVYHEVR